MNEKGNYTGSEVAAAAAARDSSIPQQFHLSFTYIYIYSRGLVIEKGNSTGDDFVAAARETPWDLSSAKMMQRLLFLFDTYISVHIGIRTCVLGYACCLRLKARNRQVR